MSPSSRVAISCTLVHFACSIKVGFRALSRNVFVHTHVNKIEAIYKVSRVNVKVERGSTFTFTHDLSYMTSVLFTHIN